jgi:conjugative transfer signal peptidase TraF
MNACMPTIIAIASMMVPAAKPLLAYNCSASAPPGLYMIAPGRARRGTMVLARLPDSMARLAADRGYLPRGVPMLKQVAAVEGDRVCAEGEFVLVDEKLAALRLSVDGQGRRLPAWSGCRTVGHGEILLLNGNRRSFDGRYFGVTRSDELIAVVRPVRLF